MKVLIATDGSAHADAALEVVLHRPWSKDTHVRVIGVVQPLNAKLVKAVFGDLGKKSLEAEQRFKEESEKILSRYVDRLQTKFVEKNVSSQLLVGDSGKTIINVAADWEADLLIVGAHGLKHDQEPGIGSVAEYVLHNAPCSVEIIRPTALGTMVTEIERKQPIEEDKYLIAVDDSEHSRAALKAVTDRHWPKGSFFKVITVIEPLEFAAHAIGPWQNALKEAELSEEIDEARYTEASQMLAEITAELQKAFPDANVTAEVVSGEIRKSILEVAKGWPADLVIMGSHDERGFMDSMLGRVSRRVASLAQCSVLVVKPPSAVSQKKQRSDEVGTSRGSSKGR